MGATVLSVLAAQQAPESTEPRTSSSAITRPIAPSSPLSTLSDNLGVATLRRTVVEYANLDHGATAPALISVANAVDATLRTYGSVHRGAGHASQVTTRWYEEARSEVGRFVGKRDGDVVIFTRNTTDAFSLLAHALPRDTQVFAFRSMHHAALLPWPAGQTTRLDIPHSHVEAEALLDAALSRFRATSDAPALVVITGACNVTGEIWPITRLAAVARRHGVRSVVDAAQLAPHRRLDLAGWGADYVAISGHKMYAPYGSGALVGARDWLDAAAPYFPAGGASHRVTDDGVDWAPAPARHEGGTPNAVGAIALAAAARALTDHHEQALKREHTAHRIIREGLESIDGVRIVELFDERSREGAVLAPDQDPAATTQVGGHDDNVGVTTFTVEGYDPTLVAQVLSDEYGIAVRDGRFCAHLLCDSRIGDGATAVRASLGLASTAEHAERLVSAVRTIVEHGPSFTYTHTPGVGWSADDDARDRTEPRPW